MRVEQRKAVRRGAGGDALRLRKDGVEVVRALPERLFVRIDARDVGEFHPLLYGEAVVDGQAQLPDGAGVARFQKVEILQNAPLNGVLDGDDGAVRAPFERVEHGGKGGQQHDACAVREAARRKFRIAPRGAETGDRPLCIRRHLTPSPRCRG